MFCGSNKNEQEAKVFEPALSMTTCAFCDVKLNLKNFKSRFFRYYILNFCPDLYFQLLYQFQSTANWKQKVLTEDILFSER